MLFHGIGQLFWWCQRVHKIVCKICETVLKLTENMSIICVESEIKRPARDEPIKLFT